MSATFGVVVKFSLIAFTSILFLVDPFAVIPAFLTMTADENQVSRRQVAWRAAVTWSATSGPTQTLGPSPWRSSPVRGLRCWETFAPVTCRCR